MIDWYIGFFIGTYEPLISRAYDNDCYASLFSYGISSISLSSYFDTGKELKNFLNWLSLLLPSSLKAYDTYKVINVCIRQTFAVGRAYNFRGYRSEDDLDEITYLPEQYE